MKRTMAHSMLALLGTGGALGLSCCSFGNADDSLVTPDDNVAGVTGARDTTGGREDSGGSGGSHPSEGSPHENEDADAGPAGARPPSAPDEPGSGGPEGVELYVEACSGIPYTLEMLASDTRSTCMEEAYSSEALPVDLVIMMDRSISMAEPLPGQDVTRWDGIRTAVQAFVRDPEVLARRIRMSIQFFSQTAGFIPAVDCDIANYLAPKVPMGFVADNGAEILSAVDAVSPSGQTPTLPALQGALQYAKSYTAAQGEGRAMAVVLVTDGLPTQCQDVLSLTEIANVAAEAYKYEPSVRTFVVGIGPALENLHQIACRGGTHEAFLIEEGDAAAQFVDALKHITLSDFPCEFEVPQVVQRGKTMDYDRVRVHYTPESDQPDVIQEIPALSDRTGCFSNTRGGWYFDNPDAPTKIVACPCTCTLFRTGLIRLEYGCSPLPL